MHQQIMEYNILNQQIMEDYAMMAQYFLPASDFIPRLLREQIDNFFVYRS